MQITNMKRIDAVLLLVAITEIFISDALNCFSHEHCGDHAVCVNFKPGQTPKCMCLVGFVGNGARCESTDPSSNNTSNSRINQLILRKSGCSALQKRISSSSASSEEVAPPGIRPPSSAPTSRPRSEEVAKSTESVKKRTKAPSPTSLSTLLSKSPIFDFNHESLTTDGILPRSGEKSFVTPPQLKGIPNTKVCSKVVCNFDADACRYRSLGGISWVRKPRKNFGGQDAKDTDFVASVQPTAATDQYLASENFILLEQAEFSFKYFESDRKSHLQVCDNDLSHCFWQSDGADGKWEDVLVVLPSGSHRIIFAVSNISPGSSIAIDDIRLETNAEQAVCV